MHTLHPCVSWQALHGYVTKGNHVSVPAQLQVSGKSCTAAIFNISEDVSKWTDWEGKAHFKCGLYHPIDWRCRTVPSHRWDGRERGIREAQALCSYFLGARRSLLHHALPCRAETPETVSLNEPFHHRLSSSRLSSQRWENKHAWMTNSYGSGDPLPVFTNKVFFASRHTP